ncbi:PREDICTED: uncharacterized protein LOC105574310 isoform X2 [Cercocebus atys]|nr:PREDICTED: uncharacterized protein LOC105574310 isoform X2 [Cercocebus atys]
MRHRNTRHCGCLFCLDRKLESGDLSESPETESSLLCVLGVLKQFHPYISTTLNSLGIMNDFLIDIFEHITTKAGCLVATLSAPLSPPETSRSPEPDAVWGYPQAHCIQNQR